jgi:hypothetical protein
MLTEAVISFIFFSFLEYFCNKNIINSSLFLKDIIQKEYVNKEPLEFINQIIIFFKKIYKDSNFVQYFESLDEEQFLHYQENNIHYEDDKIQKDYEILIEFYS